MAQILADFLEWKLVPTAEDYAYAAALIDGEGCITIIKRVPYAGALNTMYTPTVSVEMNDKEPVLFMQALFGGHIYSRCREGFTREMHRWACSHRQARVVLEKLLPLLKIGRKQRTALACIELAKTAIYGGRRGTPAAVLRKRETLYQICREANRRGRTPD